MNALPARWLSLIAVVFLFGLDREVESWGLALSAAILAAVARRAA